MRVGMVGVGTWGKNVARELFALGALTAYSDAHNTNGAWAHTNLPGIPRRTFSELCADTTVDALAIATPIETHVHCVEEALLAGKHVFVEKPLGRSSDDAQHLAAVAETNKRTLMTGYIYLYHEALQTLHKTLATKDIVEVHCTWRKHGSFKESLALNLLTHHIALGIHFFGDPTSVEVISSEGSVTECDKQVTELYFGKVLFRSDIDRTVEDRSHRCVFVDSEGTQYEWDDRSTTSETPLTSELKVFLHGIGTGAPIPSGGTFAARVLTVYEEIMKLRAS